MHEDRFWVVLDRDVVAVEGPQSEEYLQGQLSQDVVALPDGGHAWSWLLAPNGKVDALLRVFRRSEGWLLDTDGGWGEVVLARLQRFRLRTKVELRPAGLAVLGLRGDGWDVAPGAPSAVPPWPGVTGADVLLDPDAIGGLRLDGAQLDRAAYEPHRIAAGIPRMGAELDERTIPAETGLVPVTVSFTKGCYTGQELVARIDSRGGHAPRRMVGLRLGGPVVAGTELTGPDGAPAGTVTSAAAGGSGGWVGLGYLKRSADPSATLQAGPGGPRATVVELVR